MRPDNTAPLWDWDKSPVQRFGEVYHYKQEPGDCVRTCLGIVMGYGPSYINVPINTQDPVSWSEALKPHGMKLAYCPCDIRLVKYYHEDIEDGLWLVGYYLNNPPPTVPDEFGWLGSSHLIVVWGGMVYDPMDGATHMLEDHSSANKPTKRIFRVVESEHPRGL